MGTAYCSTGQCTPKKPLGQPATGPNECLGGYAADGICCNNACTGTCAACTTAKKGEGADGTCGAIMAGGDPDDECNDLGDGVRDQRRVRRRRRLRALPLRDRVRAPACAGATLDQGSQCSGTGACIPLGALNCPALCVAGACTTGCALDADCGANSYRSANACAPKKPDGALASAANECLSAIVADGVCCGTACGPGPCMGCSVAVGAAVDGVCGFTNAPCDDGDECTSGDTCHMGVCKGGGGVPACPAAGECQVAECDAAMGCIVTPAPDSSPCGVAAECTVSTCHAGACAVEHKLDETPCEGGVCVAGACLLDPVIGLHRSRLARPGPRPPAPPAAAGGSGPLGSDASGGATEPTAGAGGAAASGPSGVRLGGACSASPGPVSGGGWLSGMLGLWLVRRSRRRAAG